MICGDAVAVTDKEKVVITPAAAPAVAPHLLLSVGNITTQALTMLLSSSIGTAYILFCMSSGPGSDTYTLFNVWIGILILVCSRALTFTFRHFLDPRGPLAVVKASAMNGDGGYEKEDTGEDVS